MLATVRIREVRFNSDDPENVVVEVFFDSPTPSKHGGNYRRKVFPRGTTIERIAAEHLPDFLSWPRQQVGSIR